MVYIFPRMTKCTFHKFGTSGEIEKHDALCILPLNIFNEKIYIFLWFWMFILGILTLLVVIYRLLIIISSDVRAYLLKIRDARPHTHTHQSDMCQIRRAMAAILRFVYVHPSKFNLNRIGVDDLRIICRAGFDGSKPSASMSS